MRRSARAATLAAVVTALAAVLAAVLATGCATAPGPVPGDQAGSARIVQVVAAENVWGAVASQIGGRHARVVSIINSPNADPHSYEPTAADARVLAAAKLIIENGIGYDPWMPRLLAAGQGGQTVLDVGALLKVPADGNPHRWYNPADVAAVSRAIAADLARIDPADAAYFARQRERFDTVTLRAYHALIARIRARYAGTRVGASESIFAMLAPALGLRLITPATFLRAISEGGEVSAADKLTIDRQIARHQIAIYVYNSQNVTPDVRAQIALARAARIPVATITETIVPAGSGFAAWQVRQLRGIEAALARARGR